MIYLLKTSAVLSLFYLVYIVWLQKETFFKANRWYLIVGLITSCILPLVSIPVYVEQAPLIFQVNQFSESTTNAGSSPFSITNIGLLIYALGAAFLLIKFCIELFALRQLIKRQPIQLTKGYKISESTDNIAPFSFFKHIIYNPAHFSKQELADIINHEKTHADQYHSVDILFMKLIQVFFWFNPIVWLYKKALIQNLEFLADSHTIKQSSVKTYQHLLLKTSLPNHQLAFTTNFYNSLIKKRIIMLHKSNSKSIYALKYLFILPLLLAFLMGFNTKTIFKNSPEYPLKQDTPEAEITAIITKNDSDEQLDALVSTFESHNVTLKIKHVKRNASNEITAIAIDAKSETNKLKYNTDSDSPISPIKITFNSDTNNLKIGEAKSASNIVFTTAENAKTTTNKDPGTYVITTSDGANSFVIKRSDFDNQNQNVMFISEDGKTTHTTIKNETITWTDEDDSVKTISGDVKDEIIIVEQKITEEEEEEEEEEGNSNKNKTASQKKIIHVMTSVQSPLIILDGKEIAKEELDALKPDAIQSMNVLKGGPATEKYGDKGKDGVIEIISKN